MYKDNIEPVIIAGGGVGGLGAALALAARGYRSILLEAQRTYDHVDRGDILHVRSSQLLERWGALPALLKRGPLRFTNFRIIDEDGRRLFEADTHSLLSADHDFFALRHQEIAAGMHAAAIETGKIEIRSGEHVIDLCVSDGRISGVKTEQLTYHGPLVVLATGRRAPLRDKHFGATETRPYGTAFFNACVRAIPEFANCGFYVLGKGGVMVLVPLPGGKMRIGLQYEASDRDQKPNDDTFAEIARKRLKPLRDATIELLEPGRVYALKYAVADRMHIPGCVLLGDTAHLVHPVGGQGMNLALADAEELASQIDAAGASDPVAFDAASIRYAKIRQAAVAKTAQRIHMAGLTASWQSPQLIALRDMAIRCAHYIKPIKRALMQHVTEVR